MSWFYFKSQIIFFIGCFELFLDLSSQLDNFGATLTQFKFKLGLGNETSW
jgi:hypothetical protein